MGGRGSSSGAAARGGGGALANATPQQQQKVKNLQKMLSNSRLADGAATISMNADGDVEYQYTKTRPIYREKGGKMSNPAAADMYERTEYYSGKIKPDGYISRNKMTKKDILVQKGKR